MRYAKRLLAVLLAGLLLSSCGGKTKEEQALASLDAPKAGQERRQNNLSRKAGR